MPLDPPDDASPRRAGGVARNALRVSGALGASLETDAAVREAAYAAGGEEDEASRAS